MALLNPTESHRLVVPIEVITMSGSAAYDEPSVRQYTELAEVAGGFIHEIKNRVGTLSLNLQLLGEDFENPETPRERRALERITRLQGECQKLVDLASDFLRFARVHDLTMELATLDSVVSRNVDFLAPTARDKNIEIGWLPAPDLPLVNIQRDLFEQCLLNLMLNAEQAMPEGGTLTLIGRWEETKTHQAEDSALWVCLDVIDTGYGIPPEQMPKLFRPFHTTKTNGHGLGLAITRKIITAHGGTIEVQSEIGRGTKFTIRLPATKAEETGDRRQETEKERNFPLSS
jgi:two-component system sensor histidine kinase HydH